MRINKLISIMAVAMLVACPLIALASDEDSNGDNKISENGYYFEVSGNKAQMDNLLQDTFIKKIKTTTMQYISSMLDTNFVKLLKNTDFYYDSCTIRHGQYMSCVMGESNHTSAPTYVEFKGLKLTFTSTAGSAVIFKTQGLSEEMAKFIDENFNVTLSGSETVVISGDMSFDVANMSINSFTKISEEGTYAITHQIGSNAPGEKTKFSLYDLDLGIKIGDTKVADVKFDTNVTTCFDSQTDFLGIDPAKMKSTDEIKLKFDKIVRKYDATVTLAKDTSSKTEKRSEDMTESLKEQYSGKFALSDFRIYTDSEFQDDLEIIDGISLTNVIKDKNDEETAMGKILALGGKCTINDSEAKRLCDSLNYEIMGITEDSSFPGILVAIIAVVAIAFCAFGIVVFGKRY